MKNTGDRLVTAVLTIIGFVSYWLSVNNRQKLGRLIGSVMRHLSKKRREITLDNLRHAFPEKSPDGHIEIMKKSYHNLGIVLAEVSAANYFKEEDIRRIIRFKNVELINELHSRGKGLILMSGHFGNWELLAYSGGLYSGISITIIVKRQKNKYADKRLNEFRTSANNKIVPMYRSARVIVKTLLQKGVIALLADQSADKKSDLYIDFFGRPAPTYDTPAVLALKFDVPIVMGFAVRDKDGTYTVELKEIKHDDLTYGQEGIRILTERHTKALEDAVRKNPEMWVWQHRRWKHSPKEKGDFYDR